MNIADAVNPPPAVQTIGVADFRVWFGIGIGVVLTSLLLFASSRFDRTGGTLTISLLIVLGFLGAVSYCLIFTIPTDEVTPGIVGGLTAGFGAVCAHWLGKPHNGANGNGNGKPSPADGP